jgi:putative membrane protein
MSSEAPRDTPAPGIPPRRLHPAEVALAALDNLRELLVGMVVVLLVGGGPSAVRGLMIALGGLGVAIVAGYLRWSHTTYWVAGRALHFRTGVFSPDDTSIPIGRIQALDAIQGPVQRLFGVHSLHVQTAGGGSEGEIVLRAVAEDEVQWLRKTVGLPDPVERDLPEWRLGPGSLLVAALTAPQLGVIAPLVGAAAAGGQNLVSGDDAERLLDRLPSDMTGILLLAAAVVAVTLLLSVLGGVVAFAGFTLVRDEDRLRIRRGLLQRRTASLPLSRVHAVDVVEGVLRRPFGLATVRLETAGYRSERAVGRTLLPLVRTRDLPRLLAELAPALAIGEPPEAEPGAPPAGPARSAPPLKRPPARARRRYAVPPALAGAVLGGALTVAVPSAWPAIPVLAFIGAAEGLLRHRAAGWSENGRHLVVRSRRLARRTLIARVDRLQEHGTAISVLQRRAGLADFHAAVGSGRTGRVRHLDAGEVRSLFERLRPAAVRLSR